MYLPLDGPSKQNKISVTTATRVEVKSGTEVFSDRKVITLQPISSMIKVYFADDSETVTAANVIDKGFEHPKKSIRTYEATSRQTVYMIAIGSNTDVIVAERG